MFGFLIFVLSLAPYPSRDTHGRNREGNSKRNPVAPNSSSRTRRSVVGRHLRNALSHRYAEGMAPAAAGGGRRNGLVESSK